MIPQSIDVLIPQKSLIDLSQMSKNSFDSVIVGYDLSGVLDDVLLAEFVDETSTGEMMRNGIVISTNAQTNAWRIGKVILAGPTVKTIKVGDFIMFPNNMGIPVANIDVAGYGTLSKGLFINEQRIFGSVTPRKETNNIASVITKSKKSRPE